MQWSPIELTTIRGALTNELLMYDLAWENLELFGGKLEIITEDAGSVTVKNIGWGAAYNVTTGGEVIEKIEVGETKKINKNSNTLLYKRLIQEGEEADLTLIAVNLTTIFDTSNETTPSINFVTILISLAIVSTLRRRK